MTVNNVAPTVTLTPATTSVNEGTQPHLQLHHQRPGRGHVHARRHRLRHRRQPGRAGHLQHHHRCGQLRLHLPRRPGQPDRQRARSATPTAPPDSDTSRVTVDNVAPTVDLTGDDDGRRGLDPHLQLHRHRSGRGHLHVDAGCPTCGAQRHAGPARTTHDRLGRQLPVLLRRRAGQRPPSRSPSPTPTARSDTDTQTSSSSRSTTSPRRSTAGRRPPVNEGTTHTYSLHGHRLRRADTSPGRLGRLGDGANDRLSGARHGRAAARLHLPRRPGDHTVAVTRHRQRRRAPTRDTATVRSTTSPRIDRVTGAANVNEGSTYSLTLGAVTDPGTDTVTSYVVHWGDGTPTRYATERRQDPHLRRRPGHLRRSRVDLIDEDGTFLDRANAPLGDRQQRRPDRSHLAARRRSTRAATTPTATRSAIRAPTPSAARPQLRHRRQLGRRPSPATGAAASSAPSPTARPDRRHGRPSTDRTARSDTHRH